VANFGFSLALDLGFKDVYLVGVDCGMVDVEHHHSKASNIYFDDDGNSKIDYETSMTVAGNFREKVYTNDLFKMSQRHLEAKIDTADKNINVYNLNDGALILGAKPLKMEEVTSYCKIKDKSVTIDTIMGRSFKPAEFDHDKLENLITELKVEAESFVTKLRELLIIKDLSFDTLGQNFKEVEKLLRNYYTNNIPIYTLFNGSVRGVMLNVMHDKKVMSDDVFSVYAPKAEILIKTLLDEIERDIKLEFLKYEV
jgi:hypothetical protein